MIHPDPRVHTTTCGSLRNSLPGTPSSFSLPDTCALEERRRRRVTKPLSGCAPSETTNRWWITLFGCEDLKFIYVSVDVFGDQKKTTKIGVLSGMETEWPNILTPLRMLLFGSLGKCWYTFFLMVRKPWSRVVKKEVRYRNSVLAFAYGYIPCTFKILGSLKWNFIKNKVLLNS